MNQAESAEELSQLLAPPKLAARLLMPQNQHTPAVLVLICSQ